MSEWWTYTLSDFLLFSPRTYYRLFELHNAAWWPVHVVAVAGGVAIVVLAKRDGPAAGRAVAAMLAVAWAWVAWAFLWQRYATINWAAPWLAAAFVVQAVLFGIFAIRPRGLALASGPASLVHTGLAVAASGVLAYPLASIALGRGIAAAEVFGMAPDPTVFATLGILVLAAPAARLALLPIPLAWCAMTGATLWTMGSPEWWLLPAAAVLSIAAAIPQRHGA
jgi:hypothetical protein